MESFKRGHNPVAIANYFLGLSQHGLSLVQLIKLSYIAHGFKLGFEGFPLANETVEAWQFGPVFPSIYYKFKPFGINIKEPVKDISSDFNNKEKKLMDKVFEVYGNKTAVALIAITHAKDSPWDQAWNTEGGQYDRHYPIDNNIIKKYYEDKIKESQANV